MDILKKLAIQTKLRYESVNNTQNLNRIAYLATTKENPPSFYSALNTDKLSIIAEVKKASPSKGIIAQDFPFIEIAKEYEASKVDAISVLTEPTKFLGSNEYLKQIAKEVTTPILKKDFFICEYQIYEAKVLGASAILLIVALLDDIQLKRFYSIATSLGLDVLVETHTEDEIKRALNLGFNIIGVNNRNLKTFDVDIKISIKLSNLIPNDKIFISESGISNIEDVKLLRNYKIDGILIGEMLMRSHSKGDLINELKRC